MRLSLAQLMAMRDKTRQPYQGPSTPVAESTNTIYYTTAHITVANNGGFVYHVAFGPKRSISTTMEALTHIFPRVKSFLEGVPAPVSMDDRNNHFRWTETNDDEVLVKVEQERNPAVCANGLWQELFAVIHRVTDYEFSAITEHAEIVGTFTTNADANAAALRLFISDIEGHAVEGVAENVEGDGRLCKAQSPGQGGWRWTVEVMRATWQEAVH